MNCSHSISDFHSFKLVSEFEFRISDLFSSDISQANK